MREEDRHIADRIRRLNETVDELEEEYDKHLSWCTSPGLSYSENGLPEEVFAPAVTDSIMKAASASKLTYFYGSSMENGMDRDERGGSPLSPAPRRSVVSLSGHSVSKSKSGDFYLSGRICEEKETEANGMPHSSTRKWSTNWSPSFGAASRNNRAVSPSSANDYCIRAPVRLTPIEPKRDPLSSLKPGQGSFKKRHSCDVLVPSDTEGQSSKVLQPCTQSSTLPRHIVFRGESEPGGIPDIVCTPEPATSNTRLDREETIQLRGLSAYEGMSGLSPEISVPLMRSASTGVVSPLENLGTNSLPRGRLPLSDDVGKKMGSRINDLRSSPSIRSCQSLPRGMNPKMLRMYSGHSADNPVLREDEKSSHSYGQRSKSYEDLDQINNGPEPTRMSKRWKLPFFNRRNRDRQSSGKPS